MLNRAVKSFLFAVFSFLFLSILSAQPLPGSYYDFLEQTENMEVKPNPATLIIYRPENKGEMNMVVIEMENGKKIKLELYPEIAPNTVNNFISFFN